MKKIIRSQRGFSMVQVLIGAGLLGALAFGFSTLFQNQNHAIRGINGKMEILMMRNAIYEIMRNPDSCASTIQAASATPPALATDLNLNKIVQAKPDGAGGFTFTDFYTVGRTYSNLVKLVGLKVRPQIASDDTPGHKLVVDFQITGSISGVKDVRKTMEFSFDPVPSAALPGYNFNCMSGILGAVTIPRCRVCLQASDHPGCAGSMGPTRCSAWSTSPSTPFWTPWTSDSDGYDPDCFRVGIECQ